MKKSWSSLLSSLFRSNNTVSSSGFGQPYEVDDNINKNTFANWSGACVNKRAQVLGGTRFYLSNGEKEVESVEFKKYAQSLNKSYGLMEFVGLIERWLLLLGNCYILVNADDKQAWVLQSNFCAPIFNEAGDLLKVEYFNGTKVVEYDGANIVHIKKMGVDTVDALKNYYLGTPTELNAALSSIVSDSKRATYIKRYLDRDGTPPFVVLSPQMMQKGVAEDFLNRLNERLPSSYIVAATLDAGKTIAPLQVSAQQSLIGANVSEDISELVCVSYGIPKPILTGNHQNRATANVVKEEFYSGTIEPELKLIVQGLNKVFEILGVVDDNVRLHYDDARFYDELIWNQQIEYAHSNQIISNATYAFLANFPPNTEIINDAATEQIES